MFKDLSELYLFDPNGFISTVESLIQAARPMSQIREEALSAEARECLASARHLLSDPNLFNQLDAVLHDLGYAGDTRPALMTVALTSRLLEAPMNQAYISQSAAGKNAAAEAPLPGLFCFWPSVYISHIANFCQLRPGILWLGGI